MIGKNNIQVLLFTTTGQLEKIKVKDKDLKSDDEIITYKDKSYKYKPEDIYYHKGKPTIVFYEGTSSPVKISEGGETSNITPKELNKAVNNNIVKDLLSSTDNTNTEQLLLIGLGICIVGLVALGWFSNELMKVIEQQGTQIDNMMNLITDIKQVI